MENQNVYNFGSLSVSQRPNDALKDLLMRAKEGEEAAFSEIYNLYFPKIYQFIFFRIGHKEIAEDLAEDVFLKAYASLASIDYDRSFNGWIYQVARNTIIDYYRARKLTVDIHDLENTLEYETNVIDVVNLNLQQKTFFKLLKELPAEQQVVIKLKFFEGLENSEIAELLQKTEGAIRVIQHRAISKLQELIKELNQDE